MMGWYITLAVLILLAILPLGASVLYDEEGPRVRVVAGPLKIQVFPLKKKPKKDKPQKEKPAKCNGLLVKCNTLSFPILFFRSQNTFHSTSIFSLLSHKV